MKNYNKKIDNNSKTQLTTRKEPKETNFQEEEVSKDVGIGKSH